MPLKIFIEYGFGLSGVKDVATHSNNKLELQKVVSKIVFTKIYLLACAIIIFLIVASFIPKINLHFLLYLTTLLTVIGGQSLIPVWFFQGLEETKTLLLSSILARAIYLILIFLLINQPKDYLLVNVSLGISELLLAFFCLFHIVKLKKINLTLISFNEFKSSLKENFPLAKTNFYTMTSLTLPFTFLGFVANEKIIGYYSIADKLMQVIRTSAAILYSSVFPRIIHLFKTSHYELATFIKKFQLIVFVIYIGVFVGCFFFTQLLMSIFINKQSIYPETILSIKILSVIPLIAALDIIPSLLLLATGQYKKYAKVLFYSCMVSIISTTILVKNYSYIGASIASVTIEIFTLIFLVISNFSLLKKLFSLNPNESI